MEFKFVFPTIHINIKGQIQLEVNWTQINHFIVKNVHITKIPTPPTFLNEFV